MKNNKNKSTNSTNLFDTNTTQSIIYSITIDNQTFDFHSLREYQRMLKKKGLISKIDYTSR